MNEEFQNITGFDIGDYFNRFNSFIVNKSQNLINYYSGLESIMDRDSYKDFKKLYDESLFVINLFDLNYNRFKTIGFWQLMEFADDIRIKLETIYNFSKYARSSVNKESFTTDSLVSIVLRKEETIEQMLVRYGSTNIDDDWVSIALSNAVIQEDYTSEGGKILNITFKNNSRFFVQSIVDNPEGDKIKGKDVYKQLTFEDDDLKVLGYDDTLQQNLDILIGLKKNDNPEFPSDGIDKTLVTGVSFKSMLLPALLRQVFQTFSSDDIVSKIEVLNTDFDENSMKIDINIIVKSGEERQMVLSI